MSILSAAQARAHGLTGLVIQISRDDHGRGGVPLAVRLSDQAVNTLYGADYAARTRWVELPARSTRSGTSSPTSVASTRDTTQGGAAVLTPQVSSTPMLMAAISGPTGADGTGSFAATPSKPALAATAATQTGDFAWTYPLRTPPAGAGPSPTLALQYESQSVDRETGSTDNQPSGVGQGWSLTGSGSISRVYTPCSVSDGARAAIPGSGDLCYSNNNATITFAGHTEGLVNDGSGWHLSDDDSTRVQYLTGAANGTADGGYWVLTTTDGTKYYFGQGTLPSNGGATNSVWTVPVCGTATESCSGTTPSAESPFSVQAWAWNLDEVVDTHGSAEVLRYAAETNRYAEKGAGSVAYTRAGELSQVDYGLRTNDLAASASSDNVRLGYTARCETGLKGEPTNACTPNPPATATAAYWPDVPADLACTSTSRCSSSQVTPTFWSALMLSSITTEIGPPVSGTATAVDVWTLSHSWPAPGDGSSPALWLTHIGHTGYAAGAGVNGPTSIATPATTFSGAVMPNRVNAANGLKALDTWRITGITTDTGSVLAVSYSARQCTPTTVARLSPQANTDRCFPAWWTPQTTSTQAAVLDWFHTYVVTRVTVDPHTGGAYDAVQETDYVYYGTPAWRFDQSPGVIDSQRTWSVWAGYSAVEVRQGSSGTPATQVTTDYRYFQGLAGDPCGPTTTPTTRHRFATGCTTSGATRVLTAGSTSAPDSPQYAGRTFETITRIGANGGGAESTTTVLSDTVTVPWSSETAASSRRYSYKDPANGTAYSGTVSQNAWLSGDGTVTTTSPLSSGGSRTRTVSTSYDGYGRPTQVQDATTDAGTTCTNTSYATDTTDWLLAYPDRVTETAAACGATPSLPASTAVSRGSVLMDTRTLYDQLAFGSVSSGEVSETDTAIGYTSSTDPSSVTWRPTATYGYDALGRVTSSVDPNAAGGAATTTTAYTPAGAGGLTQTVVTNPKGWTTTTTMLPEWGVTSSVVDPNGNTTTTKYDALGRTSQVWEPNRPEAKYGIPSDAYSYTLSTTTPNVVATTAVNNSGGTLTSYDLLDGLGRTVQTQAPAEGGGVNVVDTGYDSDGRTIMTTAPYDAVGTPSATRIIPTASLPSQTRNLYDGAGRETASVLIANAAENALPTARNELWRTSTAYSASDRVDTTPPAGGTPTSTYTDSRGDVTTLVQYLGPLAAGTPTETTNYTYDPASNRTGMTSAAGSWSWTYNVLGQQISATDPATGATTTSYTSDGQVASTTDNAGTTLAYSYDQLGRKTGEYAGTTSGVQLAGWTYDTATAGLGQPASSTRYVGGSAGQPGTGTAYTEAVAGYTPLGSPTASSTTLPAGALGGNTSPLTYTTSYTYAAAGGPLTQVDPAQGGLAAEKMTTGYDTLGMPIGLNSTSATYLIGTTYTHLGQLGQLTLSNNTESYRTYSWDPGSGRLIQLFDQRQVTSGDADIADHYYTYDNAGDLIEDDNVNTTDDVQCFTYDALQHLTQAWTPPSGSSPCSTAPSSANLAGPAPYWTSYTVDPGTGNRTQSVEHATSASGTDTRDTYTYPTSGLLTGGAGGPSAVASVTHATAPAGTDPSTGTWTTTATDNYAYNNDGSTTSMPGQTLGYDAEGRQQSLTLTTGANAGSAETDVYDADGTLLLSTNPVTGTTAYLGDTELHAAAGSTTVLATRTYTAAGQPIAERDANSDGTNTLYFLFTDPHSGSALAEVNDTTAITTRRYLDPFGNPRGTAASWSSDHGFGNAPIDPLTGTGALPLSDIGTRPYAPSLGRFLGVGPEPGTTDPVAVDGYSYADNNPLYDTPTSTGYPTPSSAAALPSIEGPSEVATPDH